MLELSPPNLFFAEAGWSARYPEFAHYIIRHGGIGQESITWLGPASVVALRTGEAGIVKTSTTIRGAEVISAGVLPRDRVTVCALRLGMVSLCAAFSWVVFFILGELKGTFALECPALKYSLFVAGLALSIGMFLLTRSPRISMPTLHNLGLVYEVLSAAAIALKTNGLPWPEQLVLPGWSPVAVWVMVFPLVVTNPPGRALLATIAAAAMDPLAVYFHHALGFMDLPATSDMLRRFTPNLVAVVIGGGASFVMFRINRSLEQAHALGSYHLVRLLGRGGMGEVWQADHRMLARTAAVKLIRNDDADNRDLMRRFEREARATAGLRSPHTIIVYDFGITHGGMFYYVMELLEGLNLSQLVKRFGPQPAERAVHFIRQACHSLHEAHSVGLVHRDIKPSNLFVCRYGCDVDFLKVLDFGLVKVRKRDAEPGTMLTRQGMTTGTPAFMSPEMVLDEGPIDGRADIYALGCVAYWLLTGRLLFEAESPMKLMVMQAKDAPVPPSQRTELEIPPELERIVMSCLEKDPAARPQTARELAELLDAFTPASPWTPERAEEWWLLHHSTTDMPPGNAAVPK